MYAAAVNDPSARAHVPLVHSSNHSPSTTIQTKTTNKRQQSDPANLIVCLVLSPAPGTTSSACPPPLPPPLPVLPLQADWPGHSVAARARPTRFPNRQSRPFPAPPSAVQCVCREPRVSWGRHDRAEPTLSQLHGTPASDQLLLPPPHNSRRTPADDRLPPHHMSLPLPR